MIYFGTIISGVKYNQEISALSFVGLITRVIHAANQSYWRAHATSQSHRIMLEERIQNVDLLKISKVLNKRPGFFKCAELQLLFWGLGHGSWILFPNYALVFCLLTLIFSFFCFLYFFVFTNPVQS